MKTTMASAALLLVLALALVAGGDSKNEKKGVAFTCGAMCDGRKGVDLVVCNESCELSNRVNEMSIGRIHCNDKCTQQKGITKPAMKVCQEQCEKDYKVKAAQVTAACNKTCDKETNKTLRDGCKMGCTPRS